MKPFLYSSSMRAEIIRRRGYPAQIAGDELALTMSSYPQTARYLASRLAGYGEVVCELCCGIGVSLIELARVFKHAVGIDYNSAILADCEQNFKNAGVSNYTLLQADISQPGILEEIQADTLLYAIPYWDTYSTIAELTHQNPNLRTLIHNARKRISNNIVIYAPPTMTYTEAFGILGHCEFNEVFIDGKHDRNFIFIGDLMERSARTRTELFTSPSLSVSESLESVDHTERIELLT